jgi:hypothetical protein
MAREDEATGGTVTAAGDDGMTLEIEGPANIGNVPAPPGLEEVGVDHSDAVSEEARPTRRSDRIKSSGGNNISTCACLDQLTVHVNAQMPPMAELQLFSNA